MTAAPGPSHFNYLINLKLVVPEQLSLLQEEYPGATDVNFASRNFHDYNECITSCKKFMDDAREKATSGSQTKSTYIVNSEVNPLFSGQPTLSKDWSTSELARLWLFDKKMDGANQIVAIGQARIFKSEGSAFELESS